jgi:hypothetical protein
VTSLDSTTLTIYHTQVLSDLAFLRVTTVSTVAPTISITTSTPLASEGPDVEQVYEPAERDSFADNDYFAAYNDYVAHNDWLAYSDWLAYCEYLANNDYVAYNDYLAVYDYWQQQVNRNFGLTRVSVQGRPIWVSPYLLIGSGDTY